MPIRSYSKNARKAYARMRKTYGSAKKAKQVFYALANQRGKGKSRRAKVNSTYKKRKKK